jgi:hypothetical protein
MRGRIDRLKAGVVKLALLAGLLALCVWAPGVATALISVTVSIAAVLVVWAATQPILVTFAAGLWAGWRMARRRGWAT